MQLDARLTTTPATVQSTTSSAAPKPESAHIGSAIALKGVPGDRLTVTLTKVDRNARATDNFSTPDKGKHYVAVQFVIANASSSSHPYVDAPSNGAVVIDAEDQQFATDIVASISSGPMFPSIVKIAPGGSAKGYLVFQVPLASRLAAVQFSLSSGFGDAGQWYLTS